MSELSVDEAQRLARLFLTGQASELEIGRLQSALSDDQGAALELLAQMQSALDDSAPAGLNAEQNRSVNGRIEALVAPRVKKRGPFGFLRKLFKAKPKATEEEAPSKSRRRRGNSSIPQPEPVAVPDPSPRVSGELDNLSETLPGDGLEEMAPIAAPPAIVAATASAATNSERGALPAKPASKRRLPTYFIPAVIGILGLLLLGLGVRWFVHRPKSVKPAAGLTVHNVVAPSIQATPTPSKRTHRGVAVAPLNNDALPAEIPATTPVSAGNWPQ